MKNVSSTVALLIANYEGDPEASHGAEDELLELFVRERAAAHDLEAVALTVLLDAKRTRWYA